MQRGSQKPGSSADLKRLWPVLILLLIIPAFWAHEADDKASAYLGVIGVVIVLSLFVLLGLRRLVGLGERFKRLEIGTDAHLNALLKAAQKRKKG